VRAVVVVERWECVMRLVSLYHCQHPSWVGPVNIGALLLFPGLLISLRGDVEWPARSPDLSPCESDEELPGTSSAMCCQCRPPYV